MVQLVARPPIHIPSLSKWDPQRKDDVFLYIDNHNNRTEIINREAYRYRLTIIDHPKLTAQRTKPIISRRATKSNSQRPPKGSNTSTNPVIDDGIVTSTTTTSFTYTNAVFLIPAGRESEFIFSSLTGLRSILKSANTARLIAVAFGRNFSTPNTNNEVELAQSTNSSTESMSIEIVQEELRYVVQMIASAIPSETLEVSLVMKPDTSTTFYPFLALNGMGQRNIIDAGTTTCSGRYIVEQCAISSSENNDDGGDLYENEQQQWVRRLYFLDGNPNVIQSEVYVSCKKSFDGVAIEDLSPSLPSAEDAWIVDKSVTAFDYHKSLTAGLLAFLPVPDQLSTLTYNGLLIGLGGGGLMNLWHYIHGDIDVNGCQPLLNKQWNVTAIELDEAMVKIASKNFGLSIQHPNLRIQIGNGLDIRSTDTDAASGLKATDGTEIVDTTPFLEFQNASLDYIVLDVDSKETGAGMSCPPASFIETSYLQTLHALLHPDRGILAINVAARDIHLFHKTCQAVKTVFPYVCLSKRYPNQDDSVDVNDETDREPKDLNVVVFAARSILFSEDFFSVIPDLSDRIGQWMSSHNKTNENTEVRALLKSILKESLTDFVPYAATLNAEVIQEQSLTFDKSNGSDRRRKNRGGKGKKR